MTAHGLSLQVRGIIPTYVFMCSGVLLERLRRAGDSPDPGDDYLLAMAAASGTDFLVTGDKALLSMTRIGSTSIVSPRRFVVLTSRR